MKHKYYYYLLGKILRFLIPEQKRILYYGIYDIRIVPSLNPLYALCICDANACTHGSGDIHIRYFHSRFEDYIPEEKFDYIVLDVALGKTNDICELLKNVFRACEKHTRVIIHQENHLWQPLLKLAAALGMKNKEKTKNWLSVSDINTFLKASGFEPTRTLNKNIFPLKLGFAGPVLNWFCCVCPFFDFFKLDQFVVARPVIKNNFQSGTVNHGVTICITVRDEEKSIEPLVASLPVLCGQQEIIFVEGHSKDNTVKEINKMQSVFPEKNIRLIHQKGKGQGDAIRTGFNEAKEDIIILYEGDGTCEPNDLFYVYECMLNSHFEFIEGSRFTYPLMASSMPFFNKTGNIFFAKWFSLFLKQRITDVLSGIKAIMKHDFESINATWGHLGIHDPFGDFELLYGAARYSLKIGEIPIHYKPRTFGKSKTRAFRHGMYLFRMALKGYWVFRNSKSQTNTKQS